MYQTLAWQLSLLLMAIVLAGFVFVILRSGDREDDHALLMTRAYRIRTTLFWVIVAFATPAMLYSLVNLPYAEADTLHDRKPVQVIDAVGHQWYWTLSESTVAVGTPVEFRVTSADVNHGFAIYDSSMKLVAQTMAMPEYINTLRHTFDEPGTYQVLCLEYCGLIHHSMIAEIQVGE